jgi:hypothetical protein
MDKKQEAILKKWATLYKRELKNMLKADGNFASGSTDRSIKSFIYSEGIFLQSKKSLQAISEGKSKAKKEEPSFSMVRRIDKWRIKKNISIRGKTKGPTYRQRMRAAYVMARHINRSTWKGSKVIDRAYAKTEKQLGDELTQDIKDKIMATLDTFKQAK